MPSASYISFGQRWFTSPDWDSIYFGAIFVGWTHFEVARVQLEAMDCVRSPELGY